MDSLLWRVETRGVELRVWSVYKTGNKGNSSVSTAYCTMYTVAAVAVLYEFLPQNVNSQ